MFTKPPSLLRVFLIKPPRGSLSCLLLCWVSGKRKPISYLGPRKGTNLSFQPCTRLSGAQNGTVFGWEFCYVNKAGSVSTYQHWSWNCTEKLLLFGSSPWLLYWKPRTAVAPLWDTLILPFTKWILNLFLPMGIPFFDMCVTRYLNRL